MADLVFNIAKGRAAARADLPLSNDALILVLLKTAGIEADGTLQDYATLSALLAAANDEADFTGYARRTLASVVVTTDNTNNRVDVDAADPAAYTNSGGSAQAVSAAVVCYDPDTTTGTDTTLEPQVKLDSVVTFDVGVATSLSFNAAGFYRAS